MTVCAAIAVAATKSVPLQAAEPGTGPAGHWEGNIQLPKTALGVRVDLERLANGSWSGTIDIPVQALRGFKLGSVSVAAKDISFALPGIAGDPRFAGELDAPGKSIRGNFTQSGQTFPFALDRKAKAEVAGEAPSKGVPGKGLAGYWQGSLKANAAIELRLVLELTNAPGGTIAGVLVSVDQGGAKIPITSLSEKEGGVQFETKSVGGSFTGKLNADGSELAGDWKQGPGILPLGFKRLAKAPALSRPQDPKKPYPYHEEEVSVETKAPGVALAGTFTCPRTAGPHPAVVLITGSGAQDRDEAIMGHRPFLVLADYLTRKGIAVLRCDDRGFAKSTGKFAEATDADFVQDALAQVAYLRGRKEIDAKRIGLIGHSEGGTVAPRAAAISPDIAFIVLLAGVGVPMEDLLLQQAHDIAQVTGAGEAEIAKNAELQRRMFRLVREEKDPEVLQRKIREAAKEQLAGLTEERKKALSLAEASLEGQLGMVRSPWFKELLAYDPRPTLQAVKCPVLALNGERDLQVAAKPNLAAIRENLLAGGNRRVKTLELPGLNHLFQTCQTGAIAEYGQIDETFNPKALASISDWILETTSR